MDNRLRVLNSFWLKIIAMVAMTLDHIGIFLCYFSTQPEFGVGADYTVGYIFRIIGRIAMPIFLLLLVEGIRNTSNHMKYILRIGITMAVIMVFEAIIYTNVNAAIANAESPFVDLFLIAITLYLIHRKDKYSYFAILPIAYILLTTGVQIYERVPVDGLTHNILWLPFYVRPAYSIFGLAIALGFYFSYSIADRNLKSKGNFDDEQIIAIKDTIEYRAMVSPYMISMLAIVNVLIFALGYFAVYEGRRILDLYNFAIENYSLISIIFILMYNGKRGYNKKWFKYGCYIYFPVHLILIFIIFFVLL
ncbi:MAG: conjugal transfer protein TraX [Bacilli bacterium]|nr:conjugal transfer protein TraX [Bacilli bacterium]